MPFTPEVAYRRERTKGGEVGDNEFRMVIGRGGFREDGNGDARCDSAVCGRLQDD